MLFDGGFNWGRNDDDGGFNWGGTGIHEFSLLKGRGKRAKYRKYQLKCCKSSNIVQIKE